MEGGKELPKGDSSVPSFLTSPIPSQVQTSAAPRPAGSRLPAFKEKASGTDIFISLLKITLTFRLWWP